MSPTKTQSPRWLLLGAGLAAIVLFAMFVVGIFGMSWSSPAATDNWLIILFKHNLRPQSTDASTLAVVSPLDIGIMLLIGVILAAIYPALASSSRAWAAVSVALPFLGIPIFLATATAGRSAVLLATFISSILALRSHFSSATLAYSGLLASSLLLFVGDFGTAAFPPSRLLAAFIGAGYIIWTGWLLLVSLELLRESRLASA